MSIRYSVSCRNVLFTYEGSDSSEEVLFCPLTNSVEEAKVILIHELSLKLRFLDCPVSQRLIHGYSV